MNEKVINELKNNIKPELEAEVVYLNERQQSFDKINEAFKALFSKNVSVIIDKCNYRMGCLVNAHKYSSVANQEEVEKDTIDEEGRKILEVLDLGFGKCRMCVCGPHSAADKLLHHERIRVASKYPVIAKEYFNNKKNQTVDIIKLNGSVELGPIVGLADVIVDIVETGSTLKENGLEVLEEICPLSARMIVNPVSMQLKGDRIKELVLKLKEQL